MLISILEKIYERKVSSISELAKHLGTTKALIEQAIDTLIHGGYLTIDVINVKKVCPVDSVSKLCAFCPFKDKCSVYPNSIRFYEITEKGLNLLKNRK